MWIVDAQQNSSKKKLNVRKSRVGRKQKFTSKDDITNTKERRLQNPDLVQCPKNQKRKPTSEDDVSKTVKQIQQNPKKVQSHPPEDQICEILEKSITYMWKKCACAKKFRLPF